MNPTLGPTKKETSWNLGLAKTWSYNTKETPRVVFSNIWESFKDGSISERTRMIARGKGSSLDMVRDTARQNIL